MPHLDLLYILLAFLIGAIVGLRNEITHANQGKIMIGGFRSYGIVAVIMYFVGKYGLFLGSLELLVPLVIFGLILVHYVHHLFVRRTSSISMETSLVLVVVLSYLLGAGLIGVRLAITLAVLASFLMAYKQSFKKVFLGFNEAELKEVVLFAVLVFAILPWLPNRDFSLYELFGYLGRNVELGAKWLNVKWFNPYQVLFIVAVFSFVKLVGYILSKFVQGVKVWIIQALVGGFISSTTTTISLAGFLDKKDSRLGALVAILLANLVSFVEVFLLVLPFSITFAWIVGKISVGMILLGALYAFWLVRFNKWGDLNIPNKLEGGKMLDLSTGLKFAVIFTIIRFVVLVTIEYFGHGLAVLPLILLGVTGIDIASINLAVLVNEGSLSTKIAALAFVGVNIVNLLAKVFYVKQVVKSRASVMEVARIVIVLILGLVVGYVGLWG